MKSVWIRLRSRVARIREAMREVPDITASRPDVVVDTISLRRSVLRFFGERIWVVTWRSVHDPLERGVTRLTRDMRAGSASVGGESFSFLVRWRGDLRRPTLRPHDDEVVSPLSVMQLARLSSSDQAG